MSRVRNYSMSTVSQISVQLSFAPGHSSISAAGVASTCGLSGIGEPHRLLVETTGLRAFGFVASYAFSACHERLRTTPRSPIFSIPHSKNPTSAPGYSASVQAQISWQQRAGSSGLSATTCKPIAIYTSHFVAHCTPAQWNVAGLANAGIPIETVLL